jgi:hypothetical protein
MATTTLVSCGRPSISKLLRMFPVINAIRDDDERAEIVRKPNR